MSALVPESSKELKETLQTIFNKLDAVQPEEKALPEIQAKIKEVVNQYLPAELSDLSQRKELRDLIIRFEKIFQSPFNTAEEVIFNFHDYLGEKEISSEVFPHLDKQIPNIVKEARTGNSGALELLKKCAFAQTKRNLKQEKSSKTQSLAAKVITTAPEKIEHPTFSTDPSQNAFLALVDYHLGKNDAVEALNCWYRAVQETNYNGSIQNYPKLDVIVKEQYAEHTRRLPEEVQKQLLDPKYSKEESLSDLTSALIHRDYIKAIHIPDVMDVAVAGLKKGVISIEQVATLGNIWGYAQDRDEKDLQKIELFDAQGNITQNAKDYILYTMISPAPQSESLEILENFDDYLSFLDGEGVLKMLELVRSCPSSEHCFYVIPDDQAPYDENSENQTISQFISYQTGINVFSRISIEGQPFRIIPSSGMDIAFLKTSFEKCCLPNFVQGPSTDKDIIIGQRRMVRDVAVPSPHFNLPRHPDALDAPLKDDFVKHDKYHVIRTSTVANHTEHKNHVDAFLDLAETLASQFPFDDPQNWVAEVIYNALIDLEFSQYIPEEFKFASGAGGMYDLSNFFWETLAYVMYRPFISLKLSWQPLDVDRVHQVAHHLLEHVKKNQEEWKKYGIRLDSIKELNQDFEPNFGADYQSLIRPGEEDMERRIFISSMASHLDRKGEATIPVSKLPTPVQSARRVCETVAYFISTARKVAIVGTKKNYVEQALTPSEMKELNQLESRFLEIRNSIIKDTDKLEEPKYQEIIAISEQASKLIEEAFNRSPEIGYPAYGSLPPHVALKAKRSQSDVKYLNQVIAK